MKTIREKIIAAGVRSLQQFGYPDCNNENIMTDKVFKAFFESQLQELISGRSSRIIKEASKELLAELLEVK